MGDLLMNDIQMKQLEQTLTSMEVAEMVEKTHANMLRDIKRYCKQMEQNNITGKIKIDVADFFRENTYKDEQGKERLCFDITKKGCEFIAHKLTGVKGTAFTAQYINRFHDMEQALKKPHPAITEKDPFEHWEIRWKHETETWFSKNNWKLSIILERFGWTRKFLYHKILVELSDLHNLRAIEKAYYASYGYPPEYALDLLDFNRDLNDTATRYINYLLIEE
jgi:Rha family phage regulatory protein|nr:MAG TPA: regulatory protein [Caudoviricetes sp.]